MKVNLFWIVIFFLFLPACQASDVKKNCINLSCIDISFIKKNPDEYRKIFSHSLDEAKKTKGKKIFIEIFEFSTKIRGRIASEQAMSHFVEHEFMRSPDFILSIIRELSPSARKDISHYLAFPTYIHGSRIKEALDSYKDVYPQEYKLIFSGK